MPTVSSSEARHLIEQTFDDFIRFLRQNRHLTRNPKTPYALTSILLDLEDWESARSPEIRNYLFEDLSSEGYNYLLEQCSELASLYNLSTKTRLQGSFVLKKAGLENKTVEKLTAQIRKFGDGHIAKKLEGIETGSGFIVFEGMDSRTGGYTKFENGQVKYCLNKKYEKITAQEDLWRASIILAHELQRNPATGDLRGETAEIAQKDVTFIEQLAKEHGDKVYELNPDFLVMHYVREMFGDEGVKAFADIAFSREGSYWRVTGPFRRFLSAFDPRFGEQSFWDFNAIIMESSRALQSIGSMITEALRTVVETVNQQTLITLQDAIDNAVLAVLDEIWRICENSSARGTYKLKEGKTRRIKTTIELVVELDRHGKLKPMLVAGVSWFHQKPTKVGIIEFSIGLRQTFDISLLPGNPISNFINAGGLLGVIRDTMTTMAFAIDAKLSWIVAEVGILLRRDLLDFSNRNIQALINLDTLWDNWIAGVQFTFGGRKLELRVNVSDWLQNRR
ncbi:MAG: hypothetical protein FWC64_12230 [Treponema sp.]|nr:hypothetical protein [Treponema sp.]